MAPANKAAKATKSKQTGTFIEVAAQKPRPQWPALEPVIPKDDLVLHHLMPGQIVTVSNFWASSLCKSYVKFLSNLPLTTTPGVPKKGNAVRVNDRFQIDDAAFAEKLWSVSGLKDVVLDLSMDGIDDLKSIEERRRDFWGGHVLGLNSNIRIYRYRPGQFFDQHYDESNSVVFSDSPPVNGRTTWTLLLYLTSPTTGCIGGETIFYPEAPAGKKHKGQPAPDPIVVGLETGMALLHKHGKDCMIHEGSEVTAGEKWVIRSDIVVQG
ncbi:hypothetical protein FH972_022518 [Carpinus fangiana]|uniref:Fe2OG dioxygenase domain-containing protein n=1 Tax=Carpinus fangiana TaxID=176857 RepID=A0A5N6KT12_9ROSI|nr:hypothetical protein FH972_022518 [Carpinus fangiana]